MQLVRAQLIRKNMKKLQQILVLSLVFIGVLAFNSCEKESLITEPTTKAIKSTINQEGYYVLDGVLCFNEWKDLEQLNETLSSMEFNEIEAWEKSIGFTSFLSEYSRLSDKVGEVQTLEEYENLLVENSNLIYEENDQVKPRISISPYQQTTNINGLFMIGEVLHKAGQNELIVYNENCSGSINEIIANNEIAEVVQLNYQEILKSASYCGSYIDQSSQESNDRICQLRAYVIIENGPTGNDMQYWYSVTCATIALKRNLFNKLYEYNTSHHHAGDVEIVIEAKVVDPCTGCTSWKEHKININSPGSTGDQKFKHWISNQRIGAYHINEYPNAPVFKRIKGTFWTRGSLPKTVNPDCGYGY